MMWIGRSRGVGRLAAASGALALTAAAIAEPTAPVGIADPAPTSQAASSRGFGRGYLPPGGAPDSLLLEPPPPAPGSAAFARDEEAAAAAVAERGSARWDLATADADLFGPNPPGAFSCAAAITIGPEATPLTFALLRRLASDLAAATYPTKLRYKRPRPFTANRQPTCRPQDEPILRNDGSYPSGHSAIGYGWSLVLAELVPGRAAELVARGRVFGDSRRVCNAHWLSDVEEGRVVAAAVIARVHAEPEFRRDLDAARMEIAAIRSVVPPSGCAGLP